MRILALLGVHLAFSVIDAQAQISPGADSRTSSDTVRVCVVQDGQVREIVAEHDPHSSDTTIGGTPLRSLYPPLTPPYLAGAEWYARDEMVVFEQRRYVRYGLRRVIGAVLLTRVGEFRGIPLFAESRQGAFRIVYALVNPGCEFQPYWYAATVGEVRGR